MNDRQKVGMLSKQLKIALEALDRVAEWGYRADDPFFGGRMLIAREALRKIRGGDGRPKSKRK